MAKQITKLKVFLWRALSVVLAFLITFVCVKLVQKKQLDKTINSLTPINSLELENFYSDSDEEYVPYDVVGENLTDIKMHVSMYGVRPVGNAGEDVWE